MPVPRLAHTQVVTYPAVSTATVAVAPEVTKVTAPFVPGRTAIVVLTASPGENVSVGVAGAEEPAA